MGLETEKMTTKITLKDTHPPHIQFHPISGFRIKYGKQRRDGDYNFHLKVPLTSSSTTLFHIRIVNKEWKTAPERRLQFLPKSSLNLLIHNIIPYSNCE